MYELFFLMKFELLYIYYRVNILISLHATQALPSLIMSAFVAFPMRIRVSLIFE